MIGIKPYFAKWLPVEGDIKEGDTFIDRGLGACVLGKDGWIEWKGGTTNLSVGEEHKKHILFICSRKIRFGRGIYHMHSSVEYECSSRHTGLGTVNLNRIGEPNHPNNGSVQETECYQVVGKVSIEAKWVKEDSEFDEEEIHRCFIDGLADPMKATVQIKGPCGHFH